MWSNNNTHTRMLAGRHNNNERFFSFQGRHKKKVGKTPNATASAEATHFRA